MKIEKSKYQGYIWYSNENTARVFDDDKEFDLNLVDGENPFVVEGFLFDGRKSISIKFVDGQYVVLQYDVANLPKDDTSVVKKTFQLNDKRDKKMLFHQIWCAEKDALCDGMEVLQPAEFVFMGFTDK